MLYGKLLFQIGIIGGSGLSHPEILRHGEEKNVDTPFGKVYQLNLEDQGYVLVYHTYVAYA